MKYKSVDATSHPWDLAKIKHKYNKFWGEMWENSNNFFEEAFGNIFQILYHMYIFEKLMEMCIYWLNSDNECSLICNSKYLEAILHVCK